jgi:translation initiation factor 2B subunit (eIF-2B alpha/beta/delta family)
LEVIEVVKVSKESLEAFQSVLETVDTSWQTEFNLRETVRQSFDLIKKVKQHKVSWEKIAEILKQSTGMTDGISPESIRQYYFEFSKNPDLLPKKKRKSSQNKKKLKDSTIVNSASKIKEINSETTDINQLTSLESKPEVQLNIQSSLESTAEESNSDSQAATQPVKSEPDRKAKDDVRSQFNLGRRKN